MYYDNPFKTRLPEPHEALPGRLQEIKTSNFHNVLNTPLHPPFADNFEKLVVGMGCFWGAERLFWQCNGVFSTAVGYAGGQTPNPTYEEVCSGRTGHTEAVLIIFDPSVISLNSLLTIFWEEHNPTQYMRQGNDRGTQYRSALYAVDEKQLNAFHSSAAVYQKALTKSGYKKIQTEIKKLTHFYYAEDYHQQYLHKVPNGYCGLSGCGISYDYTS